MSGPDLATWATVIGTWILVVGTLTFVYWQMRQSQRINSAQSILDLRGRFDSTSMRAARRELATELLTEQPTAELSNYDPLIFFQLVGSMTRERILDRRMVWNAFGVWVTAYFYGLTHPVDRIARWRSEGHDPLIFADLEWLVREVDRFDRSMMHTPPGVDRSRDDSRDTLESESQLVLRSAAG
jgi:hypothetical protein